MLAGEKGWGEQKIIMHRGTPAHFFFQCDYLVIFRQIIFRGALLKFVKCGVAVIFNQLITNLGLHCAFKMSGCRIFYCGFMYPLKN